MSSTSTQCSPFGYPASPFTRTDAKFSDKDDIIASFDLDYPRADSFKFWLTWVLFVFMPLKAFFASLPRLLIMSLYPEPKAACESLYTKNGIVMDGMYRIMCFMFEHGLPWWAANRHLRLLHVAIARNGIIVAKERRPSLRNEAFFANVVGSSKIVVRWLERATNSFH